MSNLAEIITVVVPSRLDYFDGISILLEKLCQGLDELIVFQVVSACNEAFNNVIEHAQLGAHGQVEVQMERTGAHLALRIIDDGRPYESDFTKLSTKDEDWSLREHGMGWTIIRNCMNQITYERRERNILSMIRYLEPKSQEP